MSPFIRTSFKLFDINSTKCPLIHTYIQVPVHLIDEIRSSTGMPLTNVPRIFRSSHCKGGLFCFIHISDNIGVRPGPAVALGTALNEGPSFRLWVQPSSGPRRERVSHIYFIVWAARPTKLGSLIVVHNQVINISHLCSEWCKTEIFCRGDKTCSWIWTSVGIRTSYRPITNALELHAHN